MQFYLQYIIKAVWKNIKEGRGEGDGNLWEEYQVVGNSKTHAFDAG